MWRREDWGGGQIEVFKILNGPENIDPNFFFINYGREKN